jgi:hypothetical protein
MTALDLIATFGVFTSVVILVVRVWLLANTLEMGSPPAPPEDPPTTDPAVTPSDPFDALLVDLELFRLTTMAPAATEVPSRLSAVPEDAVVAELEVVGGRGHLTRERTATCRGRTRPGNGRSRGSSVRSSWRPLSPWS